MQGSGLRAKIKHQLSNIHRPLVYTYNMPELPEVETVKRGLLKLIVGKTIKFIEHDWPKSFPNSEFDVTSFLVGASIKNVRRRAKVLIIDLSTGYSLVIHLKMTGQMVYVKRKQIEDSRLKNEDAVDEIDPQFSISNSQSLNSEDIRFGAGHPNDSLIKELPDKSTRVIFVFNDDSHLYFNDQRKFGWVRLMPTIEVPNIDFMKKVGPEPLEPEFTAEVFINRIQKRANTTIKAAILDQTVLAGVGNIYADESLWGANIHPASRVFDVPLAKLKKLHFEIVFVLNLSINKGGSTSRNYVNAEGKRGSYLEFARVFRRENLPCPRCATIIKKIRVAGRGTHVCPKCQVLPKKLVNI